MSADHLVRSDNQSYFAKFFLGCCCYLGEVGGGGITMLKIFAKGYAKT